MKPSVSTSGSRTESIEINVTIADIYNDHKQILIRERLVDAVQELDDHANK
jgi:hypothetical protein